MQGLKEKFECIVVPHSGVWGTNRIMHGSYNWTKAANYNGETLVTTVDRNLVKKFADEFMKIYNENK